MTAAPKLRRPKPTDAKPHLFLTPEQRDQLLAVLAQRVAQGDADGVSYRRAWTTSRRLAGVPEIHPHALRHAAATRWAWLGVDRPTAMRLGGWRSAEMLYDIRANEMSSDIKESRKIKVDGIEASMVGWRR